MGSAKTPEDVSTDFSLDGGTSPHAGKGKLRAQQDAMRETDSPYRGFRCLHLNESLWVPLRRSALPGAPSLLFSVLGLEVKTCLDVLLRRISRTIQRIAASISSAEYGSPGVSSSAPSLVKASAEACSP